MKTAASDAWNAGLYQASHSFVWEYGHDVLGWLAPSSGERILDLGCETGQLTAEIAATGAQVFGVDRSPNMIEEARRRFPTLPFAVGDAADLPFCDCFNAVFSNAVLHWVTEPEAAVLSIGRALVSGGRFVAEFGGRGNTRRLLEAVFSTLASLGVAHPRTVNRWFFPSIAEYSTLLERHGLEVTRAELFDRPTALQPGANSLEDWFTMFGASLTAPLSPDDREEFLRRVKERARPALERDGRWMIDYRRIRIKATRVK